MHPENLITLQFPIGKFTWKSSLAKEELQAALNSIERFPKTLNKLVSGATAEQREWPYRSGGWNTRILVHHCADSHLNAFVRFKWALSENKPLIKPYDQSAWAALEDYDQSDLELSLQFIEALHKRWMALLSALKEDDFKREYHHPEHNQTLNLEGTVAMYAWHCEHHLAHIRGALASDGKYI